MPAATVWNPEPLDGNPGYGADDTNPALP